MQMALKRKYSIDYPQANEGVRDFLNEFPTNEDPSGVFSRDEATLYERVSVCPSFGPLVGYAFAFRPARSDLRPCIRPCFKGACKTFHWMETLLKSFSNSILCISSRP